MLPACCLPLHSPLTGYTCFYSTRIDQTSGCEAVSTLNPFSSPEPFQVANLFSFSPVRLKIKSWLHRRT